MPKKKPGSVHTARNGARYKILANGRARFISGPTKRKKATGRKRRGGSAMVGGSAGVGGSASVGGSMRRRKRGGGMISSSIYNAVEPMARRAVGYLPF